MKSSLIRIILPLLALSLCTSIKAQEPTRSRMDWWREARFGMFIHWNPSSLKGVEIGWDRQAARPMESIGMDIPVPSRKVDPVYDNLPKEFNPVAYNPKEWVQLARDAGMGYMVFTTKHHDGFAMWPTKARRDHNIARTPWKNGKGDILRELADAAHAANMPLGWYYSPRDWTNPDYGVGNNAKYETFMKKQITEILSNYGKIAVLWWDSFGKGNSVSYWHAPMFNALTSRLQPGIIINDRCNYYGEKPIPKGLEGDYDTPEQIIGKYQIDRPWESCITLGGEQWSFKPNARIMSFDEVIRTLISCATGDGNLLLNVGPMADGRIEPRQADVLREVGKWMSQYGETIKGTRGGPFKNGKWGGATFRGNTVYLHLLKDAGNTLLLPALGTSMTGAENLTGGQVQAREENGRVRISLDSADRKSPVTIIALKFADKIKHVSGEVDFLINNISGSQGSHPKVREVIVVCKTHFDLGYTHRVKDLIPYFRTTMIDRALATMDKSADLPSEQQFAWTAPGWVMAKVLEDWPGQTKQRHDKLEAAFHNGKFVTHALPFSLESDACEAEEIARGLVFASELARKNGKPLPKDAKVTDVPGHTSTLPTVLALGGVKFLHIGCNPVSTYVKTPGLFWWEGPDGSRVLTMYSVNYGTCTAFMPKDWIPKGPPEMQVGQGLLPPPDWPYDIWPAIIVTPDNAGPPDADVVKSYFEKAQKEMPGVKFRMGTMEEFAETLLRENPKIPVIKGQMPDTWIYGILSDPQGCKLSREAHPLIASAEAQRTQFQGWGLQLPSVKKEVAIAYENILLYGEHTFGGATALENYGKNFNKNNPKVISDLEGSWEDKTDYIRKADKIAHRITDENLQALAQAVKRKGDCAVVYNPLPWPRSETVAINGQPTLVSNVPPCGYKTVEIPKPQAKKESLSKNKETIENEFFKVTLDAQKGTITSLIDKRTNREWLNNSDHGIGYLNERFSYQQTVDYVTRYSAERTRGALGMPEDKVWLHPALHKPGLPDNVAYRAASPAGGSVRREAWSATLIMPPNLAEHLPATELKVSLPMGQPFVDIEMTIKNKARDNWPEADWLRLPFKVENPVFSVARALGEMNPATDILPGANQDMYSVGNGVTLSGEGGGIAICPLDHPIISLDRPGCWKFSRDFIPKKPEVFVNLYNNQWNTNFRYWYSGTWSSRIRLWTFSENTPTDFRLTVPALEARNPLQVIIAKGVGGTLPEEKAGLTASRKGVLITAFGPDPDGNTGTLLRVWEQAGASGDLTITLPEGVKIVKAQPVNLRGEKTGTPLEVREGKLTFPLKAYAPASFLLE